MAKMLTTVLVDLVVMVTLVGDGIMVMAGEIEAVVLTGMKLVLLARQMLAV